MGSAWEVGEDHVGARVSQDLDIGDLLQAALEPRARGVGATRQVKPEIAVEVGVHLRRQIAMLGEKMRSAFAAQFEFPSMLGVEQDRRLDTHGAVFRRAKAYGVYARLPRHLRRRAAKRDQRVSEACAVHVDGQGIAFGDIR